MKRSILVLALALASFAAFTVWMFSSTQPGEAQEMPTAQVGGQVMTTPDSARLAPWPTVYPHTPADNGAQTYWARCMMCHGDRGQGLNADWLSVMDPPDRNCWQSGCHNPRHPPGGFVFPKVVPPVIGAGVLDNFNTGLDLYHFLKLYMPYQDPGRLSDQTYWELTAYLLRANGFYQGTRPLDAASAAAIRIRPASAGQIPQDAPDWSGWAPYLAVVAVLLVGLAALGFSRLRRREKKGV